MTKTTYLAIYQKGDSARERCNSVITQSDGILAYRNHTDDKGYVTYVAINNDQRKVVSGFIWDVTRKLPDPQSKITVNTIKGPKIKELNLEKLLFRK